MKKKIRKGIIRFLILITLIISGSFGIDILKYHLRWDTIAQCYLIIGFTFGVVANEN